MTQNAMKLRAVASPDADIADQHCIRLTEVRFSGGAPAPRLERAPAVLVRHMLGPDLGAVAGPSPDEPEGVRAGHTLIEDLRAAPRLAMSRPFHAIDLFIPWAVLDLIADQVGAAPLETLELPRGAGLEDPTIAHLIGAMLPTLRAGRNDVQHYVDHLGLALASHIAHVYGRLRPGERRMRGGLAPHILRRAQSILRADLRAAPSLDALAEACGLSSRHFARAFRESTGLTPHRWTMVARVAAAKALMQSGPDRLADIALTCGFADQSHLTRVFKREAGVSPAAWRRAHARPADTTGASIPDTLRPLNRTFADRGAPLGDPAAAGRRQPPADWSAHRFRHVA